MKETDNPFKVKYYTESELKTCGFKSIGNNVRIAENCVVVGLSNIELGNNVIIDSFCTLIATGSGKLKLGSFVHIGSFCHLLASEGLEIQNFSGLSQGVKIYSKSDDYSGNSMTNPTIPENYKKVSKGKVVLKEHVIIGANSIILPNVTIEEGVSVGALSLVTADLAPWTLYFGNPLKKVMKKSNNLLKLKKDFLAKNKLSIK